MLQKILNVSDIAEFKKYFFNTSWMFLEKIIRNIAALFVGSYVARYLGPSNYGLLNYASSCVFLFSILAHLNLEPILVRELFKGEHKREELLGTAAGLRTLGAFFAFLLILFFLQFSKQDPLANILVLIISAGLFFQPFNVIDSYYQAEVTARRVAIAQLIQISIIAIIKIILVLNKAPLINFAIVTVLESMILAAALIITYMTTNKYSLKKWCFNTKIAWQLLKSAFPLISAGIAVLLYMRLDQIMIKLMLGNQALGNYSAAISLCECWYFIPMVISNSVFPAILNAKQKNTALYHARIQRLHALMVKIGLFIIIVTIIFGEQFMLLLFGHEFEGGLILKVYIGGIIFSFLGVASGKWLLAENYNKIIFYRTLSGLITNVALNLLLIPRLGILGAAFAAVLTMFVVSYFYDLFHRETWISFKMKSKALFFIH